MDATDACWRVCTRPFLVGDANGISTQVGEPVAIARALRKECYAMVVEMKYGKTTGRFFHRLGAIQNSKMTSAFCFVDTIMNRINVRDLVETGASHNFVKQEVVDAIGIKKNNCGINVKAINSSGKAVAGVTS